MTPLEMIKKGVLERNLGLVSDGYFSLTGERLDVGNQEEEHVEDGPKLRSKRTVRSKAVLANGTPNGWFDDGTLFAKEKVNAGKRKKQAPRIKPKRPTQQKVTLTCMACGKSDKVFRSMVPPKIGEGKEAERPNYRCNDCCGGS